MARAASSRLPWRRAVAGVVLAALMASCGGSDDDTTEAPASTRASTSSLGRVGASLVTSSTVKPTTSTTSSTSATSAPSTSAPPTTGRPPSTTAAPGTQPAAPPAPPQTDAPAPPASVPPLPPLPPPPPPPPPPGGPPAAVLDLTNWKITLPVAGSNGNALEVKQPALASYSSEFFRSDQGGVVFTAPVTGATTSGSKYPRSELREMANGGASNASWSSTSGTHVMEITQAITQLPSKKPHVVAGQIHDSGDDIVMIRLEGHDLFVEGDGDRLADLDANYVLGASFTVRIEVSDGHIRVFYNGAQRLDHPFSGDGLYFKAGVYTQSNAEQGEPPGAAGQVVITALRVEHS